MKPNSYAKIPQWSLLARLILDLALKPFYPSVITDPYNSLSKAKSSVKSGRGLVIVFTHFSLRDAMDVNRVLVYRDPIFRDREVVNPLAYYQYGWFLKLVGFLFHGNFCPIVNDSTLKKKGYEHLPKGMGLKEFAQKSNNILKNAGLVTLALNATRRESLGLNDTQKPVGYFIASQKSLGFVDFDILTVAFKAENVKKYTRDIVGGMNLNRKFTVIVGKYYSVVNLLKNSQVNHKLSNIDTFLRSEFAHFVPKEYI